ncbi:hypothetical protein M9Y10_000218 [Tritrichomonas musculus]|uniref:DUF3447 domain-containing protein n=1 Tax=Tritrichomonas musculus TaxID=1915356 RepID=A0ABR2L3M7_9EUKA
MNPSSYLESMKMIHESLLLFLEDETNDIKKFKDFTIIINDQKICDDQHRLRSFLHLLLKIGDNHNRNNYFFNKIEQILTLLKDHMKKYFSNFDIFTIFRSNKRILLFLIEEKIIVMDKHIAKKITTNNYYIKAKYPQYFTPEIQPFINEKWLTKNDKLMEDLKKDLPDYFYKERKIGENDNIICKYIQNDLIKEFVTYVNQTNYPLDSTIKESIYETNYFFIKNQVKSNEEKRKFTLIEYATFFGSIQIFKYLQIKGIKLTNDLWPLAIHGKNNEIIYILQENKIEPNHYCGLYFECIKESIKCHHNEIVDYLLTNYSQCEVFYHSLKNYNFAFIQIEMINDSSFFDLCKYDYYVFVDYLLKNGNFDLNQKTIKKNI